MKYFCAVWNIFQNGPSPCLIKLPFIISLFAMHLNYECRAAVVGRSIIHLTGLDCLEIEILTLSRLLAGWPEEWEWLINWCYLVVRNSTSHILAVRKYPDKASIQPDQEYLKVFVVVTTTATNNNDVVVIQTVFRLCINKWSTVRNIKTQVATAHTLQSRVIWQK